MFVNPFFRLAAIAGSLLLLLFFAACRQEPTNDKTTPKTNSPLNEGRWRATLSLTDKEKLPFNFDLTRLPDGSYQADIINAQERIKVTDITFEHDSVVFTLPVFGSQIKGKFNEKRILGSWYNYAKGDDYQLEFYAIHGDTTRFDEPLAEFHASVSGRWAVMFIADDKKSKTDAIGIFEQDDYHVTGTFLTPTGDYRFLQGIVDDRTLKLSCFDGAHAFLFTAYVNDEGDLDGNFWSGNHWHERWYGYRDDTVSLPNPLNLTKLKKGAEQISFSFPDVQGNMVSLSDSKFAGKVVMVQAMGTWCPNCMDETALYADIYRQYNSKGLEMVALAFEAANNLDEAKPALQRYKQHFNLPYPILYAGKASKNAALQALPALESFTSFPTTIFIDRKGKVRHIHTGFSGPATGTDYLKFKADLNNLLSTLLAESI
ncbi:MAG TPA: TlpA disulfide reductase family protein [Chitinophagales bacterium]|nr:TlpA disulfide reductase family protein [Chitinophagales bacterium]HRK26421.1 TlpA disulfide reductase family protein [Chitinophagales bacterium]